MNEPLTEKCFLCKKVFQFSHGKYNGKYVSRYNMTVCTICYDGNWDGWNPRYTDKIKKHLIEQKLPIPETNENGWFPRD